jgi:FkbM family methyltransferase
MTGSPARWCQTVAMNAPKELIKSVAPSWSRAVREARRQLRFERQKPLPTLLGFTLRGSDIQASGEFEPDEVAFISEQLASADLFVDVGANIGLYTLLGLRHGVETVAVEPLPDNLRLLYSNLRDNDVKDVEVVPAALGAQPRGLLRLYGGGTAASLVPGWASASADHVMVPVTTLDRLYRSWAADGRSMLVKIDVEGAELALLDGAMETLARRAPTVWLVEVNFKEHHPSGEHPAFAEVFDRFWTHGYKAHELQTGQCVDRQEIVDWLQAGQQAFGGHNFVFSR